MLLVRLTFVMLLLTFMTTLSPVLCTLSLHDALPICGGSIAWRDDIGALKVGPQSAGADPGPICYRSDRKSTRLNSSHLGISYAVFCLKKKRRALSSIMVICMLTAIRLLLTFVISLYL